MVPMTNPTTAAEYPRLRDETTGQAIDPAYREWTIAAGTAHGDTFCTEAIPSYADAAPTYQVTPVDQTPADSTICPVCADAVLHPLAEAAPAPYVDPKDLDPFSSDEDDEDDEPRKGEGRGGRRSDKMTDPQADLIDRLRGKVSEEPLTDRERRAWTKDDASQEIDRLKAAEKEAIAQADVMTPAQVEEWLLGLGRKVTPEDVTVPLQVAATEWARNYSGDFSFMVEMARDAKAAGQKKDVLSVGKAKGVLNCWRADLNRNGRTAAPEASAPSTPKVDPRTLEGFHAFDGKIWKVQISKTGNPYCKVLEIQEGQKKGSWEYVGRGPLSDLSEETRLDPETAAEFGIRTGVCGICGRGLEKKESIERGIGPVCAAKI